MIVGVGSWRGVGASTTALALASSIAAQGTTPWLVEADPAGGVLTARLTLPPTHAGSLERLAFPTTRRATLDRFTDAAVSVAGIRVITAPGDPFRAWACHAPRLAWAAMLRELGTPVVVDLGRLRGGAPNAALLAHLDLLLLISNADVVALAATIEWADALGRASPGDAGLPLDLTRVAIVDAPVVAERVGRTDVQVELGQRYGGWIPWSIEAVRSMHAGTPFDDRRMRRQPFTQAVDQLRLRLERWYAGDEAA